MEGSLDLPIALRRTPRRRLSGRDRNNTGTTTVAPNCENQEPRPAKTPSKSKTKKRVRFSDPGPEIKSHDDDDYEYNNNTSGTTGLTPMVRRSSLGAVTPSSKKRRYSTPTRTRGDEDDIDELANTPTSNGTEIRFVSLRQVLDDRVKRRIKRHGLSEEMNVIQSEKRQRATQDKAELERLRRELAEKDEEIERLKDVTFLQDTERIHKLEQQVEQLRGELGDRSSTLVDQTQYDWTMAARDPFSDSYMGDDGDGFGDTTMGELMCSTPSRARASFPTPPCTSPTRPVTPCSLRGKSPTPPSHVSVQACLPDPEKEALEAELGSLRLELTKLTDALESHETLKSRMAEKLAAVQTYKPDPEYEPSLEAHLNGVLQSLSDRTAALEDLNTSLCALGFRGGDAGEVVASLVSAFRSARLELEYLTPGEITLPLSSRGAEVLDLVLVRLRDLARKTREHEDAIDEYHELELSLRQQLGARVGAMDNLRRDLAASEAQLREKDARIDELEVGVDRLRGAVDGYRRDVGELEALVQRMEADADEARTAASNSEADLKLLHHQWQKETAEKHDAAVRELEARLGSVMSQTAELRIQLADVQARKVGETAALNRAHGQGLALRDARVAELRGEIDGINEALRGAHETIRQLRVENAGLATGLESEKRAAREAVERMQAELERVLAATTPKQPLRRSSRRKSGVVSTPGNVEQIRPGTFLSGGLARSGQDKKRRRYDSGLGLLEEDMDI
ncbi:hypothetical protein PGQ11_011502 [Apiospora arundinis]|uniref:Uncharacterized protein n=1 Tax=Apiospora arundinis TaxID=335852 RepID=A0ABR2I0U9_9PEZI